MSLKGLYKLHTQNVREVADGLNRIALALRSAVARGSHRDRAAYLRLYSLVLAAWAEARLAKLVYEPGAFTHDERQLLDNASSHLVRWEKLVELAFRKHHDVPQAKLTETTLPHSAYSRFQTLTNLLSSDLRAVITLRNKLAHGQWAYPLSADRQSVAQAQMNALHLENALTIQLKRGLLTYLLDIVHDLAVSKHTFERDFDDRFGGLVQLRLQLLNKSYQTYETVLQNRHARGQDKRRRRTPGSSE